MVRLERKEGRKEEQKWWWRRFCAGWRLRSRVITRGLSLCLALLENRGLLFTSLARGSITVGNLYQTN